MLHYTTTLNKISIYIVHILHYKGSLTEDIEAEFDLSAIETILSDAGIHSLLVHRHPQSWRKERTNRTPPSEKTPEVMVTIVSLARSSSPANQVMLGVGLP